MGYDTTRSELIKRLGRTEVDRVLHSKYGEYVGYKTTSGRSGNWKIDEQKFWKAVEMLTEDGR